MTALQAPKTARRISEAKMSARGRRPGHKIGRNGLRYWVAKQVVRDPMDYPDQCIALPLAVDEQTIDTLCQEYTAALHRWIEQQKKAGSDEDAPKLKTVYDGTVLAACHIYQEHPFSRFHKVKSNTRDTYTKKLRIIETTVGRRLIRNLTLLDVQHWYDEWRKPAEPGGKERIDQAHDCVSMFKTVLRFNAALRRQDCKRLYEEIKDGSSIVHFEKGGAREQEMTYAQAAAFVRKALEMGHSGVVPFTRGRNLAIGTAAQFDLALRQKDIIGEFARNEADLTSALRRGAAAFDFGGAMWTGYFVWERIAGWRLRIKTSKSKYRTAQDFDLTLQSLLFPLLEAVPHEERTGPIVKDENGVPWKDRTYAKHFRRIARAAGIPDDVWNTDARAGAATEAEEAGANIEGIQTLLTHSKKDTTLRYIRRSSAKIAEVAKAPSRVRQQGGGTT